MKASSSLFFFFLFFLFTFTTRALDLSDSDGDLDLFDSEGDPVRNGGQYQFVAATGSEGIRIDILRNGSSRNCNIAVGFGPGTLRPVTVRAQHCLYHVTTSDRIYINFIHSFRQSRCGNSTYWVVTESQNFGQFVMLASLPDFPQPDPIVGRWFRIRPYDEKRYYYKLVFCRDAGQDCRDIGVEARGYRRLFVTDNNPLIFKIDKVRENFHSDKLMVV